jgi:DNA-binding HxlR family transcriptional regulator
MTTTAGQDATMCDVALSRVFDFLGKRWNGLILGMLSGGPVGFSGLARAVTGISDSVLSERLAGLTKAGLVSRTVDPGPPVAVIYQLTESGCALLPAMRELIRWAETHPVATPPCNDPC